MTALLEIRDLEVRYHGPRGEVHAVDGVSFRLRRGETYALVGESGCGKTATSLAVLRLVEPGRITAGSIRFDGVDLLGLTEKEMRRFRGGRIGMVFQEAGASLNPVMRIGSQIVEAIRIHRRLGRKEAWSEAVRLLGLVSLPDPERQARAYPHELSGGMQQRAMLAIALSCSPDLLIADEPTTALDVTIQAQVLELLRRLKGELELTILLVTHDLGVVAENADRVGVMYAGRIVEEAPAAKLFDRPLHPYTQGLLASMPGIASGGASGGPARLPTLPGAVPDPSAFPSGCRFHPRCGEAMDRCSREIPGPCLAQESRIVSCFLHDGSESREEP